MSPSVYVPSCSNCPSVLAAALARATADEVLQSDLSAHYLPKHADSPDGIIRKCQYSYIDLIQYVLSVHVLVFSSMVARWWL